MDFTDVVQPTTYLIPPAKPDEFADPLLPINAVCEVLSPGGWLIKLAELMLPKDPVKWTQEQLAGDWATYAKCAESWQRMGQACGALARNMESGGRRIDVTWDGNAADAALLYFDALRKNLEEMQDALDAMSDEYRAVARSVSMTGQAIGGCISAIVDALLTMSISAAASAAFGWTGCAAAMGYAIGAMEAEVILKEWERMTRLISYAQLAMNASYGVMEHVGGEVMAKLNAFPLPRASYDHPAV
ncbi:WXG100 family type VII secretion target [Streptomyces sp. NPDC026206]|uniref:WXG100 family type VII secretion target n=1 Tax=Streptomyces sp. NPDC026206 TaxID=3157089 RepID=UPI0033E76195